MDAKPADWNEHFEWPYDRSRRVCMKLLCNPNPVVRALGLDITLPNPYGPDAARWENNPGGWKVALRGRIADTEEVHGGTEWAMLLAPDWGRVRFDMEEGVVVYFPVERIEEAVSLLATLRAHAVPLTFADGTSCVCVTPFALSGDTVPEVEARIEAAGFVPDRRRLFRRPAAV
jgi:hypothetical protein